MNKPLYLIALTCGILDIAVVGTIGLVSAQPQDVMTMPSRQTHGDILVIYAVDILVGTECGKNIQLNDVARDECYNRLPYRGELYGPPFNMQNMSYNEPIKENIYNHTSFR